MEFHSLDELVARGTLSGPVRDFLAAAVSARLSIVIAGAPGAGKTTLLSCCLAALDPRLRVVTAEEVFEVDVPLPNVAAMQTRAERAERPAIDLHRLVAGFLRMAPDIAVVGEVRDQEALPFLLTVSSGVTGMTTIHAASARQALTRLRLLAQLSTTRTNLSTSAIDELVRSSVDVVVHCLRRDDGPVVNEVAVVETSNDPSDEQSGTVNVLYRRELADRSADVHAGWTGLLPQRAGAALRAAGWQPGPDRTGPVGARRSSADHR